MGIIKRRTSVLNAVKSKLRMHNQAGWKLGAVAAEVARLMGEPAPVTKDGRYALLARFVGDAPIPRPVKRAPRLKAPDVTGDAFLQSYAWRALRMVVLTKQGARCQCCGATPKDGIRLNVDHIKPRRRYPELALVESNLQVLCEPCNHGKGNWDQTDWRSGALPGSRV